MTGEAVRREFLGWSGPFLPSVAALLADRHAEGGELRLSAARVVVPGARPGRRLVELLVEEAERRELRLLPPRVLTVGELPEELYEPPLPPCTPALARRAWTKALRGLPAELRGVLFSRPPPADDLVGWSRLARTVHALQEEVSGAGLRFTDVVACCSRGMLFADTERWEALAAGQQAYHTILASIGRGDRGAQRIAAVERGTVRCDRPLWLCGVVEMPRVVQRMVERAAASGAHVTALVHAPESVSEGFDGCGCVIPDFWAARPVLIPDERLRVVGRPADQAGEVVEHLVSLDGRYAADQIVVAVPDEELLPYLEQRLTGAGVPVHVGQGDPVERTRPARLLRAVADFAVGRRFEAAAALARHPDVSRALRRDRGDGADPGPATGGDSLLVALDRHLSEVLPARLTTGAPASPEVSFFARRLDAPDLLGRLRGRRPISGWAPEILELLVQVYREESGLDRRVPTDRRLLEALLAIRRAALDLRQLPAGVDDPCDASAAIAILLDEITGSTVAPEPGEAAVELLGWLELHLDDAPVAIITGFNEHFLPESTGAHAFLPNSLRAALGVVDNDRRYARDAYQLTALLASRQEVVMIAGRRTATGDPLRPSRLMFAVPAEQIAKRIQRFFGEESGQRPNGDGAGAAATASTGGSRFFLPPEPVIRAAPPIERLSVSRFRSVLANPYLFALESIRGLGVLDDSARELDGLTFGNLAHEVLELFGRSSVSDSVDQREISRFLDEVLEERTLARHGSEPLPAVRLQVAQLRARLRAFAAWQAGWRSEGWEIVAVECRTPAEGVPFMVDGVPFSISGRIDRIDRHPELGWAVLDYKTEDSGDTPELTHRKGKKKPVWIDLQLPLYRHILPQVRDSLDQIPFRGRPGEPVHLGYILLPRDTERAGLALAEWDDGMLASADEQAREVVRTLRRNVFDFAAHPVSPAAAGDFAALLGIGYLESAELEEAE